MQALNYLIHTQKTESKVYAWIRKDLVKNSLILVFPRVHCWDRYHFFAMINDLLYLLNSHSKLHIDDTFLNTSTPFRLLKITTKNTLYRAVVWFRPNGFKLYVKRLRTMVFSLKYMSVKCLGIFLQIICGPGRQMQITSLGKFLG